MNAWLDAVEFRPRLSCHRTAKKPELVSSGAVWLDEPVTDRAEGIKRLQGLILTNVDAVRPSIRRHLGLPPLPE